MCVFFLVFIYVHEYDEHLWWCVCCFIYNIVSSYFAHISSYLSVIFQSPTQICVSRFLGFSPSDDR